MYHLRNESLNDSYSKLNESYTQKDKSYLNIGNSHRMSKTEVSEEASVDEDQFEKSMVESVDIEYEDQKPKKTIGDEAILDYYNHYKKLDKINDHWFGLKKI